MRLAEEAREPVAALAFGFFGGLAALVLVATLLGLLPVEKEFGFAASAFLAARGTWRIAARGLGPATGVVVRGFGWAVATRLALAPLHAPYSVAAPGLAVFVAGAYVFIAPGKESARPWPWRLAGLVVIALAWPPLSTLADAYPGLARWRLAALYALAVSSLVATRFARVALRRSRLLRGGARQVVSALAESELRNVAIVVPFAAYALYRPALATSLRHFSVYEWSLGVALAVYVLAAVRGRFRESVTEEPWSSEAARHTQHVDVKPDPRFVEAFALFEAFVERGERREAYVAYWRRALARAGLSEESARALLERADAAPAPPSRARAIVRRRSSDSDAKNARDKRGEAHRALLAKVVDHTELNRDAGNNQRERRVQSHPR